MIAKKKTTKWVVLSNYELLSQKAGRQVSEILCNSQPKLGQDLAHLHKLADLQTKFEKACISLNEIKNCQTGNWEMEKPTLELNWKAVIVAIKSFSIIS